MSGRLDIFGAGSDVTSEVVGTIGADVGATLAGKDGWSGVGVGGESGGAVTALGSARGEKRNNGGLAAIRNGLERGNWEAS